MPTRDEKQLPALGGGWDDQLADEVSQPYWRKLHGFIADEDNTHTVFPPAEQRFRAFELTPYDKVRVVILGQDPYPNAGQAHGLAFSVPESEDPLPPSLRNIRKVLLADTGAPPEDLVEHGCLEGWATQGVLLLNTALTVRAGTKEDRLVHRRWRWENKGWHTFTDAVISAVNAKPERVVFMLWGNDAKKKAKLIDQERHTVISSSHPSPISAWRSFLSSRPFTEANEALPERRIDWARTGS